MFTAVAVTGATGDAQTAAPAGGFTNGTASATAQALKVNPTTSALSLGVTFGIALAGYTNQVAKAESRGIDLGIIGSTLAGEPCDGGEPTLSRDKQPQPLTADSRDADAGAGKSAAETFYGETVPGINLSVKATPQPLGEAVTTTAVLGQAGVAEVGGATSSAVTRVVDNNTREAAAVVDIGSLVLGGGTVRLGGLRWEAVQRTGATETKTGRFSIGSLSIGGVPVPIPTDADLSAVFALINTALAPMGIVLSPPVTRTQGANLYVDPLVISIVPSATRDQVAGTLLGALQPVREQLTDAIIAMDCGNDTYILVADIALGTVTGAGSLSLELGGTRAGTDDVRGTSLLGRPGTGIELPETTDLPDVLPVSGLGALPSTGLSTPTAPVTTPPAVAPRRELAAPASVTSVAGSRGGRLAAVALAGLLLLALVAEADRRKMRRAQRLIPEV